MISYRSLLLSTIIPYDTLAPSCTLRLTLLTLTTSNYSTMMRLVFNAMQQHTNFLHYNINLQAATLSYNTCILYSVWK